jgi:hypothetical protein
MKLARIDTKQEYTRFWGGIDQTSSAIAIPPGACVTATNYEPGIIGGYRRIDGFERYSGKPSPSAATYQYCTVTLNESVAAGDTITGATSGATGVVVVVGPASTSASSSDSDFGPPQFGAGMAGGASLPAQQSISASLVITKVVGAFTASESFQVGGFTVGAMTALPSVNGCPYGVDHAIAMNAAADNYRADIAAPTGAGPIRGLGLLRGVLYSFVDNVGATAGLIYKATAAGWSPITLYQTLSYTAGNAAISDGATITQLTSGATAVVKRQVLETGTFAGSSATGRLVITSITGTFDATHDLQVGGVTKATASSLATQIQILPGGRYETVQYNFSGSTDTIRMYGCDGVNHAFEFDGDVYVPINTGMAVDTPSHIAAHKKMLHLSYFGSLQSSAINFPFQWSVVVGASEIGMGDNITGMLTQTGDALAVGTRNQSYQLQGSSVANFVLSTLAPEIGAVPYTMQNVGPVCFWLDDRGVIRIERTQAYGNFTNSTVSLQVQAQIDAIRKVIVGSSVYRARRQYRLYGSDGTGLIMTVVDGPNGPEHHYGSFSYPVNVSCLCSGEDVNGKDIVFFGATNGMVYQADRGSSFDGEDIEAVLRLAFNHSKSPATIKQYRKATLEMTAVGYSSIRMHPDFSYGDPDVSQHLLQTTATQGAGGSWDTLFWESFYYDSKVVQAPAINVDGSGTNVSFVFYSKSDIDLGHILQGLTAHYTPRRLAR